MANPKWFDDSTYMANKLAQLKAADAATYGDWTIAMVEQAFADAGFPGPEGAKAHFDAYGNTADENISPNSNFIADQYYIFKAANLYHGDDVSAVTEAEAAYVKTAIHDAGMSAWQHYINYGTAEGINPSNNFDTNKYLDAKLAALQAADPSTYGNWTRADVAKAISEAGMNALSHAVEYADGTTAGEAAPAFDASGNPTGNYEVENQVDGGSGSTFALTLSAVSGVADNIVGTDGNDTITGPAGSLENGETVNGKGGTDTLNAIYSANAATTVVPGLTSVENINLTNHGGGQVTLNLANSTGYKELYDADSAGGGNVAFTGITDASVKLGVANNTVGHITSFGFTSGLTGSEDSVALDIKDIKTAARVNITDGANEDSIETMTITGTGTNVNDKGDSYTVTLDNAALAAKKYVIAGSGVVDIRGAALTKATEVDGSESTGGFKMSIAATNTEDVTITGGSGKDDVEFEVGSFDKNDVVNLGEGEDTLRLATDDAVAITAKSGVSGVETLRISGAALNGTLDASFFEGTAGEITTVRLDNGISGGTVKGLTSGDTVILRDSDGNGTLTVTDAEKKGTDDTLNIKLQQRSDGAIATEDFGTQTVAGVETLNITSTRDDGNDTTTANQLGLAAAAAKKVTVSGDVSLEFTTALADTVETLTSEIATTLDKAAGLTAELGSGGTVVTTGAGEDTITLNADTAANDEISLGAGNDAIIVTADGALNKNDVVDGGDGNDQIRVGGDAIDFVDSTFTGVTNFEGIARVSDGNAVSITLGAKAEAAFTDGVINIANTEAAGGGVTTVTGTSLSSSSKLLVNLNGDETAAADVLVGGKGADVLAGGLGADTMTGNAGSDKFVIKTAEGSYDGDAFDAITDFTVGEDTLVFATDLKFAGTAVVFNTSASKSVNEVTLTTTTGGTTRGNLVTALATDITTGSASSASAAELFLVKVADTEANFAGKTFLVLNDADANITTNDIIIDVTGVDGKITADNISFVADVDTLFA